MTLSRDVALLSSFLSSLQTAGQEKAHGPIPRAGEANSPKRTKIRYFSAHGTVRSEFGRPPCPEADDQNKQLVQQTLGDVFAIEETFLV